jgi:hypothetical protein
MSKDLYTGEKAGLAPELLLLIEDGRCSVSYHMDQPIYEDRPHHPMKSGSHRMEGILMATGARIANAQVEGASLLDIAPSLLALADQPIPASMDGQVLADLMAPEFRPDPEAERESAPAVPVIEVGDYEDEDESMMLQRLVDLGYLD